MEKVLVSGSQGFIGSYVCQELLRKGYKVEGIDDYSKYGYVVRPQDSHKNFEFTKGTVETYISSVKNVNYIIHCAAKIGGIAYFHKYAYDLLSDNEKLNSSVFDFARHHESLKRIIYISSSMVFERSELFPTPEDHITKCPPPLSTYGASKLIGEYFCKGLKEQYGVDYTIIRPFNCVGVGEEDELGGIETPDGNSKMMLSHVLPDLMYRALKLDYNEPFPILGKGNQVRHYTNGKDLARAIVMCLDSEKAKNEAFNISHPDPMSVLDLLSIVLDTVYGKDRSTRKIKHLDAFEYDVQYRSPDVSKAKEVLGFKAKISVEKSVKEVYNWMKGKIDGI